jgi:hypothetical protein
VSKEPKVIVSEELKPKIEGLELSESKSQIGEFNLHNQITPNQLEDSPVIK